jgi:hypothetical protein
VPPAHSKPVDPLTGPVPLPASETDAPQLGPDDGGFPFVMVPLEDDPLEGVVRPSDCVVTPDAVVICAASVPCPPGHRVILVFDPS